MNLDSTLMWFAGFDEFIVKSRTNAYPRPAPTRKPASKTCAINRSLRAKKFGKKLWGV